jgi:cytoskeleton protein RodZ
VVFVAVAGVGLGRAVANGQAPHADAGVLGTPVVDPLVLVPAESPAPVPTARPTPKPAHHPKPTRHQTRHPTTPATLVVNDTGSPCYVQVTSRHGRLLVRRILHGRQHLVFRRDDLDVVLGNAGGVRIAVDGRHAHRAGRSGEVLRFHVR